jgi:hypothetical protein
MAASVLTAQVTPPPPAHSEEVTQSAPSEQDPNDALLLQYGPKLIQAIQTKTQSWDSKRRAIVIKVLKNKEMLKGNQHLGVYPGTYDTFDAMEEFTNWTGAEDDKNGDRSIDRRPHNFYQMLCKAYQAALSAEVPKSRAMPADANIEEDRETAKVFSKIMAIIERANKVRSMLKQELMELFTGGCYFKYTRYVVDEDLTGTHKQTVVKIAKADTLPARYQCFNCGVTTPEDALVAKSMSGPTGQHTQLACPNCGTPFGSENYFESYIDPDGIPVAEMKADVPNGMVLQDVKSALNINADPDAPDLRNTCLLDCAEEVSLGWLRQAFDKFWERFHEGQASGSSSELLERQYRDMLTMPQGYASWFSFTAQQKPTYHRTWIQPMLFAEMDVSRAEAQALKKQFPKGCMLAWVGELPLALRPAKLTDEWTHASAEQKGFGLFPKPVGDPAVPIQERINDLVNKIDDYMDRLACGILLANSEYIDAKAMNGKAMLPGILNEIVVRKGHSLADISNMIFQVKGEIDAAIFEYLALLKQDMELLVATPPQTFGAGTQQGVETKGGQAQQLQTGLQRLGLDWDEIREEHAEAAENAVKCAGKNMSDDWQNTVADESEEFRAEYVHLDSVKGSVHVEPDTDQGFPMSYAEIRAFWTDILQNANSEIVQMLLQEPQNVEMAIRFAGVPGLVAPQGAMRGKMLRVISQLVNGKPMPGQDPMTGEPMDIPSVIPNKYLDDLSTLVKLLPRWAQEHWDRLEDNEDGLNNLVAYFKMCVVYEKELQAEMQLTGAGQGNPPSASASKASAPPPMAMASA